jgi:cytochrome c551
MLNRARAVTVALLAFAIPALLAMLAVSAFAQTSPSPSNNPGVTQPGAGASTASSTSGAAGSTGGAKGDPSKGAQLYQQSCTQCHGAQLEGGVGPKLNPIQPIDGVSKPLDPNYLTNVITNGKSGEVGQMPAKGGNSSLSAADIQDLVAFIIQQNKTAPAGLSPQELARSNVMWVTLSILALVLVTYLLSRYNMRWIARRSRA